LRTLRPFLGVPFLLVLMSCGSPNGPGPTPVIDPPGIVCPNSVTTDSPDDKSVSVVFTFPLATNGTPPVTVTCTAQPGALFPVGSTTVTCTATDNASRQASCSFGVTVRAVPKLSKTSFLAFGDSITFGVLSDALPAPFSLGESWSYPYQLNDLLRARYTTQTLAINNVGIGGETASIALSPPDRTAGESRLRGELQFYRPQVLFLMEGTNDLFFDKDSGFATVFTQGIAALDRMISEAQGQGVQVFLATIPPQRSGGAERRDQVAAVIPSFNNAIKALAARRGVVLVDVFTPLNANLARYIGKDDLHPTDEGFKVVASTFMAAIKANFETTTQAQRLR
jgi:lysophospholipase L1-like esterase